MKNLNPKQIKEIMLEEYTKVILNTIHESCNCMKKEEDKKDDEKNFNPSAGIVYKLEIPGDGVDEKIIVIPEELVITDKDGVDYTVKTIKMDGIFAQKQSSVERTWISAEDLEAFRVK
jgi:hypothetical protein